jgi:asparagine synthetase B (glutamine-hydrolysing)
VNDETHNYHGQSF